MTDLAPALRPPAPDLADLVRRALLETSARLRAATFAIHPGDRRRQQALDRWFAGFAAEVRGHFELVEAAVLPRLALGGAVDERTMDALAADHTWVDHLLGELGDGLGILSFGLGDPEIWVERTAAIAEELHVVLGGVLAREVRDLMPLVDVHLERDERRALDRELLRDVTVDRAPFSLAWLCDLLDDEEQAFVLGAASGASRLVYRSRQRAYRRSAAAAFADD